MKGGAFLAIEKIDITDKLRKNIIELRKNKSLSSYELSESSGHSKYWLQNIESGKTKKIKKSDLISIYKILLNDEVENESDVSEYIENILNQRINSKHKSWYDFIEIHDEYEEILDEDDLDCELDELVDLNICDLIRNEFCNMSTTQKQAALSVLDNLYYSFRFNPDLAFALLNIPVYGVDRTNKQEYESALNDLMAISAKYQDLVERNNLTTTIKRWKELDAYYEVEGKKNIHLAYSNFIDYFEELETSLQSKDAGLYELSGKLTTDICFVIERGQPNALKAHLQHFRIYDGKDFSICLKECYDFFVVFESRYELPSIYDDISYERLQAVRNILNTYDEIPRPPIPPEQ